MDLNQGPISYEPTALTTELYPRQKKVNLSVSANENDYNRYNNAILLLMAIPKKLTKRFDSFKEKAVAYVLQFRDVRNIGQFVFLGMVLLISWSGVKAIQSNYELQKQVQGIEARNSLSRLENDNLALENEYFKSSQYLEVSARQNFGLAKPGETVLLVPKQVALANTVPMPDDPSSSDKTSKDTYVQSNLRAWLDFFLHRNVGN